MSWLDRLRGGFAKTAEKVADNLTGLARVIGRSDDSLVGVFA